MNKRKKITSAEYISLEDAYNHLNSGLFSGTLPECLITLQRKSSAAAFFCADRFKSRTEAEGVTHEIALNPDSFPVYTDKEILQTMAHEMCHLWQQVHGTPPRRFYHDKQWSDKMVSIGLMPSTTGEPGGKRTGQHMDDYIIEGGLFETVADEILKKGFRVNWQSLPRPRRRRGTGGEPENGGASGGKNKYKTKYLCQCGCTMWAKHGIEAMCKKCLTDFAPVG